MSIQEISDNTRLVAFGDSWTAGHGVEKDIQYKEVIDCGEFINQLRRNNGWPKHLATHLAIPFVNFGVCNYSNGDIIESIKKQMKFLHKDDLIIVMLSYPFRAGRDPRKDITEINELLQGRNYYMVNAFFSNTNDMSQEDRERLDLSRFIDPPKTMAGYLVKHEEATGESLWEYGFRKVNKQASYSGGDFHANEKGYQIIAWQLYNLLHDRS